MSYIDQMERRLKIFPSTKSVEACPSAGRCSRPVDSRHSVELMMRPVRVYDLYASKGINFRNGYSPSNKTTVSNWTDGADQVT